MKYIPVIVTFNRSKMLQEAITSLLNQTLQPQKIVVIDNASTDDTEQVMAEFSDNSLIRYERLPKNVGGSGGFSKGVEIAMSENPDWIALSDDDAEYADNYFELINDAQQKHAEVGVFSGSVLLKGTDEIETYQRKRIVNDYTLKEDSIPQSEYSQDFNFDVFTFVGIVVKAHLVKDFGLPEARYFIWYDDSEFALRLRQHTQFLNVVKAHIYHKDFYQSGAAKPVPGLQWKEYYGMRNTTINIRKYGKNQAVGYLYDFWRLVRKCGRVLFKEQLTGKALKGYRLESLRMVTVGVIDGLKGRIGTNDRYLP